VNGPDILVRSLSAAYRADQYGNSWQYHSRSDRHSKIACWGILFDLLVESELLRRHVTLGKVTFGVNHEMSDFKTMRKKNLDLVVARPGTKLGGQAPLDFASLALRYGVLLTAEQSPKLQELPRFEGGPVGSVLLALEAKACMTEHMKARPRLYDELNSSHLTIHGAAEQAIAAGLVMVNAATTFISPDRNKFNMATTGPVVTRHKQPVAAELVIEKIREMPRRTRPNEEGFDAIGIVVVDCRNDGSPIGLVSAPPAPGPANDYHYDQMIRRIRQKYEVLFANI
jgi:hypothetical protein